jgi:hypothetical protein
MRWGISGAPIPPTLPYAQYVSLETARFDFPPLFAYAIAARESIMGQLEGKWNAANVISGDGGHGVFQLTSWYPDPGWDDPQINAHYAIADWLLPDSVFWFRNYGMTGDDLIRCTAASFNAGLGAAIKAHAAGDVDAVTSDRYGAGVLAIYKQLLAKGVLL